MIILKVNMNVGLAEGTAYMAYPQSVDLPGRTADIVEQGDLLYVRSENDYYQVYNTVFTSGDSLGLLNRVLSLDPMPKALRIILYEHTIDTLERMQVGYKGLCELFREYFFTDPYISTKVREANLPSGWNNSLFASHMLPEFLPPRDKNILFQAYWWDVKDTKSRIEYLKTLIKELKEDCNYDKPDRWDRVYTPRSLEW